MTPHEIPDFIVHKGLSYGSTETMRKRLTVDEHGVTTLLSILAQPELFQHLDYGGQRYYLLSDVRNRHEQIGKNLTADTSA